MVLKVGTTVDGFERRQMTLSVSDTRMNQLDMGVVGDLGTGKTQLLKSIVHQLAASAAANRGIRPRILIFDYKRHSTPDSWSNAPRWSSRTAATQPLRHRRRSTARWPLARPVPLLRGRP